MERSRFATNVNPARVRTTGKRENACTAGDTLAAELTRFLREQDDARDADDPPFASGQ